MAVFDVLVRAAFLLKEARRRQHSLPVRLRALSMTLHTLDVLFTRHAPQLQPIAQHDRVAADLLAALPTQVADLLEGASRTLDESILPDMAAQGFSIRHLPECSAEQRREIAAFYARSVRPLLTPLAVDAGRPFPQISTSSLNLLIVLQMPQTLDFEMPFFARLKVPRSTPRLIEAHSSVPDQPPQRTFVLCEEMLQSSVDELFPGMLVNDIYQFRILRSEWRTQDQNVRRSALTRPSLPPVVRIDVETGMPPLVIHWLQEQLDAVNAPVIQRTVPLALGALARECAEKVVHWTYRPREIYE